MMPVCSAHLCGPLVMGRLDVVPVTLSHLPVWLFAKYSWVTSDLLFSHLSLLCARVKGKSYQVQLGMLS